MQVEALTLPHEGGLMEVACNLLDPDSTPTQAVLRAAADKAHQLGEGGRGGCCCC